MLESSSKKREWNQYLFQLVLVIFVICIGYINCVAECMSGNKVKCFECNSYDDPRCADPFNWTEIPPRKLCEGCCVKIVQGIDTRHHLVTRTCISEIQINYFMVDHICMSESNRRGFLCFCNDALCNTSAINKASVFLPILTLLQMLNNFGFLHNNFIDL